MDATPFTCDQRTSTWHIKDANSAAKKGYQHGRWQHRRPLWRKLELRIRADVRCLSRGKDRKKIHRLVRAHRRSFHHYRAYRLVTPYPGPGNSWWAVPYYIVACESGGSWSAYNPSGAVGPYQLLGWGAPFPVNGWRDKMAHHRIAHQLYSSQGSSPWVCA